MIRELSCPYFRIGRKHPEVCTVDQAFIASALALPVERVSCLLHGADSCTFEVALEPPSGPPATSLITPAAVLVLVGHLKQPGLSFEQLAAHLREQRQLAVAPESIDRFFQEHGLNKTPEPPTPER